MYVCVVCAVYVCVCRVSHVAPGYGKWAEIVNDAELGLAPALQAAVRIVESAKRTVKPIAAPMAPPLPSAAGVLPPLLHAPEAMKSNGEKGGDEEGLGDKGDEKDDDDAPKDEDEGDASASVDLATIKFLRNRLAMLEKALHVEYQLKAIAARYEPAAQPTLITAEILLPTPLYPRALPTPPVMPNTPATLAVLPPQPTAAATARLAFLLAWRELYDFVRHMKETSARSDIHTDAGARYRRGTRSRSRRIPFTRFPS